MISSSNKSDELNPTTEQLASKNIIEKTRYKEEVPTKSPDDT
jgi:hypothetical protein